MQEKTRPRPSIEGETVAFEKKGCDKSDIRLLPDDQGAEGDGFGTSCAAPPALGGATGMRTTWAGIYRQDSTDSAKMACYS